MDYLDINKPEQIVPFWGDFVNKLIDRTVVPLYVNYDNQQVGIGTTKPVTYAASGAARLVVSGNAFFTTNVSCSALNVISRTPTSSADSLGASGDISWDASYIYVKTGGGWKRAAISTF